MNFIELKNKTLNAGFGTQQLDQSGAIVYEYNPLRVFRINEDKFIKDKTGKYVPVTTIGKADYIDPDSTEYKLISDVQPSGMDMEGNKSYFIKTGDLIMETNSIPDSYHYSLLPKNSITDLDTELLDFDLSHPVDILPQQSYDGSTNLILNDGIHSPKLINTRFSTTGMNTYQIVDREGDNDTNIYDEDSFDLDSSLYKKVNNIVKLSFAGLTTNGNLKVGNYVFYFKLADSDGNETDYVAESGIVSCHIGNLNDPFSIRGGIENENSFKGVNFVMSNIDSSYNYVSVYFTRASSTEDGSEFTNAYKIQKQFVVYNGVAKIFITGFETTLEASINELNIGYNVVDSAKTQAACQNMLFLGNVTNPNLEYKELADLSLHFTPHLNVRNDIGKVNQYYRDDSGKYEYYNADNIYHKLGYWNGEIYRFGVVYVLNDNTLSPVFNVRGINNLTEDSEFIDIPVNDKNTRQYITINKENYKIGDNENSKGVVKINYSGNQLGDYTHPIGLDFKIAEDTITELKKYTKGFFFVRQKRIKTTFCQAIPIGLDIISHLPVLKDNNSYFIERFLDDSRVLTHNFDSRIWNKYDDSQVLEGYAALCPEYEVNQSYFNQFFTGSEFTAIKASSTFTNQYFTRDKNYLYNLDFKQEDDKQEYQYTITAIADDLKVVKGRNQLFSSRAGDAADASKFSNCGYKDKTTEATNLVRGCFGPYIGLEGNNKLSMQLLNIMIPNYDSNAIDSYFDIRYRDSSSFYAISDRYEWDELSYTENEDKKKIYEINNIFRGDCYICNFTHRMMRNFQDSETPINDEIVEVNTWKDHYETGGNNSAEERNNINRGDVNAVKIGHWVTVKVFSNINLSFRCTDSSYPTEIGLTGRVRSFYPLQAMDVTGESKIPESSLSSAGLSKTVSDKYYFEQPDVPAIKNKFHTRIMYSDIAINDAYKNGYRVFRNNNYRDYPLMYGSLTKIIEYSGTLLCIFEHGVAMIPVNERALATNSQGGNVFITTQNVLPENPLILSNTYGSQWPESIIKTPYSVYGVDTVAKKIWKLAYGKGKYSIVPISDFKVQKFLNDNITLSEHETTPVIGIRNVKTHYNPFKNDIMFTFYDDINTIEEKVWNLCYNEALEKFSTFYSWVPSYSESIDNIFFTFDRNASKTIAKLYNDKSLIQLSGNHVVSKQVIGTLSIPNVQDPEFEIMDDKVDGIFKIVGNQLQLKDGISNVNGIWGIPIRCNDIYANITVASQQYINQIDNTYFWKHGQAGLMKTKDKIKPAMWYGKQHPFEFEFLVLNNPTTHKIFTDMQLISNKVSPESLHFEISGEAYSFADDKHNMFFRQEALKHLYQYNGGDILYDSKYLDLVPEQRITPFAEYYDKSTTFPIYYSRIDTVNEIEDYYQGLSSIGKDYQRMSGSEIVYDELRNQFNIVTHIKACPFGKTYKQEIDEKTYKANEQYNQFIKELQPDNTYKYYEIKTYGRLNGNMDYMEDTWKIQIPAIVYMQKNEDKWEYPPLCLFNNPLPESMETLTVNDDNIPQALKDKGYKVPDSFDLEKWDYVKEARIRDKYMKVKIRYTGNELAIVYALRTIYINV